MRDRSKTCRFFSGIMNSKCDADLVYSQAQQLPCWGDFDCSKYSPYSKEELEQKEKEIERHMELMRKGLSSCCEEPFDTSQVITEGKFKNHGPRFCSKCRKLAFMV